MTGSFAKVARTQFLGALLYHTCAQSTLAGHSRQSSAADADSPTEARERLALDQVFQRGKECRIGDACAFTAANQSLAVRSQSCNAEGHRDPVIAEGFDLRAAQRLSPGNLQAVVVFFHHRSHGAKVGGNGCDAV